MLDHDKNLYLISLRILITSLLDKECYREKLHVNHSWQLKGSDFALMSLIILYLFDKS